MNAPANAASAEPAIARSKEGVAPVRDRLTTTLFLAALLHGIVILGVSFGAGGVSNPGKLPALEVLLVSDRLPESRSNPDADYLAQRTQQGSGNTLKPQRAQSPSSASVPIDNRGSADGQSLNDREHGLESRSENLLSGGARNLRLTHLGAVSDSDAGQRETALLMQADPLSPLPSTDDDEQLILQGRERAGLLTSANTRESEVAVYLDRWKRKIERVGTLHFPSEARRKGLSGNPVLEVVIAPNGTLRECVIRRSSGHAQLDQAAVEIVKLSTPFDPFPPGLRDHHPVLRVAYEWEFLRGALVDSSVRAP